MRKLIVSEYVTLDGVMEAPGGEPTHPHTGWAFDYHGPELEKCKFEEVLAVETLLIGRVTYESFADNWPGYTGEFADRMNGMPKVVVSNTLTDPTWNNTTVMDGDVVAGVTELRQGDGGPIVVIGSKTLVHTLLDHDLVDELRLIVFPVTIGAGHRVFPETIKKTSWKLVDAVQFPSSLRGETYHRA
jgi:dihydrofolate reductase